MIAIQNSVPEAFPQPPSAPQGVRDASGTDTITRGGIGKASGSVILLGGQPTRLPKESACSGAPHGQIWPPLRVAKAFDCRMNIGVAIIGALHDCLSPGDWRSPEFSRSRELAA